MAKRRILFVEDEPAMVELIRLALRRADFEVQSVLAGREGLRAMRENHPDLVLLDLTLAEKDGWEVYRRIRANEQSRGVPVVALGAKDRVADRVLAVELAGMDDYIAMPFELRDLVTRIERVLEEDRDRRQGGSMPVGRYGKAPRRGGTRLTADQTR